MHKIDHPTAAPGRLFTEGDPVTALAPTIVTADWLNSMQLEIANAVEGAGLTLDKPNNSQLLAAIHAIASALVPPPQTAWTTGDVILTMRSTAASGWILCNDGTIGKAGSAGSTRANDDCEALFTLLWNNVSNTYAPVSSGRGASAAADWAAGKTIGLTKMLGRALAVAGTGGSLTARALGEATGAETHTLTIAEMPAHTHSAQGGSVANAGTSFASTTGTAQNIAATNSTGGDGAHNNMQPTTFLRAHIKL